MHAAFIRGDAHPVCRSIVCSQYTLCIHVFDVIQKCQLLDIWTGLSVLRPGRHSNKLTTPRDRNANTLACTNEPPMQNTLSLIMEVLALRSGSKAPPLPFVEPSVEFHTRKDTDINASHTMACSRPAE